MTNHTAEPNPTMNFTGFPGAGLRFLRDLAANNNADWFKPRRDEYEATVRGPMIALVADLLTLAAARKLPLNGDPEKRSSASIAMCGFRKISVRTRRIAAPH